MKIEVFLSEIDEDFNQTVTVVQWLVQVGDYVEEGSDLLELTTDKAAFIYPSPHQGKVIELRVKNGDEIKPGDILCIIEK